MRHARWLLWLGLALPGLAGAQSAAATPARGDATFAVVGQQVITVSEFQQALNVAMRKKYYHAKPPEHEVAQFQRVVGDDLVNRTLLVAEARRRGLQPDRARIDATLRDYEARYKGSKNWEAGKDRMTAAVTQQLESDSLLEQLERQVRQVRAPTEKDARAFYEANKALFVEPEQVKLSVILLTVDPSSPQAAWNAAHAEAKAIHARLLKGASFAELARLHSGDISATRSGDMGYVHRGMLPDAVNTTVDTLQPGAFSAPVQLLEGVAILKLEDRKVSRQRAFADVRERAGDLWQRAEAEAAWKALIADLRRTTTVRIDESHYLPLAKPTATPRPG
jgi:parvulin-like peptidyl-prolyl isomerase